MKWLFAFVCLFPLLAWAAPVYQCHDKWGNPIFSDQPCGAGAKQVKTTPSNIVDGNALTSGVTDADLKAANARLNREQKGAATKEDAAKPSGGPNDDLSTDRPTPSLSPHLAE